jgi:transcriptional regulator CtsR
VTATIKSGSGGGYMEITVTLTDKEVKFLQHMIEDFKQIENKTSTFEDLIHECIEMAMFEESEEMT